MAVPDQVVPNSEFERHLDTSDEWIRTRTGIRERRIADPADKTSDYAVKAARAALSEAGLMARDIGLILLATTTPDVRFPATANFVQRELGAANAYAYDVSVACSGFVFALASAHAQMQAGLAERALVIGADLYSSITDFKDRGTCVLFGDGAGAVVLERRNFGGDDLLAGGGGDERPGIIGISLHSDASQVDVLGCSGGGTAGRTSTTSCDTGKLFMDGRTVFRLAVAGCELAMRSVLEKTGYDMTDVSRVIPHQANSRIIERLAKDFSYPMDNIEMTLDRYGNTSAASVPIALDEAVRNGRVVPGDLVMLVAAGGGFSYGAILLRV
jgi:3-oxoacyl-[acyl-carrier-protein] synthase-3